MWVSLTEFTIKSMDDLTRFDFARTWNGRYSVIPKGHERVCSKGCLGRHKYKLHVHLNRTFLYPLPEKNCLQMSFIKEC